MVATKTRMPARARSLSARLLVLTILFVMLGEVLIFVPSIARYRLVFLEERLAAADLATLAIDAAADGVIPPELENDLLIRAKTISIALRRPTASFLMLGKPPPAIDASFNLGDATTWDLIRDAFVTLGQGEDRTIRVMGPAMINPKTMVDVTLDEGLLRTEMLEFSARILNLSIVISVLTAGLVYLSLHWLMVRPMRRMTESLVAFRESPEDASRESAVGDRADEIGIAQRELAEMQQSLRAALHQKTRLAALGEAVGKIHHDLRNIVSTAALVSDRLALSEHADVRKQAPLLMQAIDRAVNLCQQTLNFARARDLDLVPSRFPLAPLIQEVSEKQSPNGDVSATLDNRVGPELTLQADRNQLFRVILNLARNAAEAMADKGGEIRVEARNEPGKVVIEIADTGPGLPNAVRQNLFQPFAASSRPGGSGLGLAISHEIMRAHGGDLSLVSSDASGTIFRLELPDP